ncbi:hypothetical protein SDC9_89066 [bioreactor metagenome]|uniref:DUF4282 domain-containing protein n=1 Tax=bioreactor metagenome TaxID=1076179 RepID=A0A644ZR87_9ZZZZ
MTQDPHQPGPYEPRGHEPRYRPPRPPAADPAPGSEDPTHIWADGIGLGGDADRDDRRNAESRPTGYAAAGQPTGQASAQPTQNPAQATRNTAQPPGPVPPSAYPQSSAPPSPWQYGAQGSATPPSYTGAQPAAGASEYPGQATQGPSYGQPAPSYGGHGSAAFGQPEAAYGQPYAPGPPSAQGTDPHAASQQPVPFPGDQTPTAQTGAIHDAPAESPFAALRDLSFTESAAPKVTKYLYLLLVLAGALYWIDAIVTGFSVGGAAGIAALVGGAVLLAAWILLIRVGLEVALAVIRLGEDTRAIRANLGAAASDDATPDDSTTAVAEADPGPSAGPGGLTGPLEAGRSDSEGRGV